MSAEAHIERARSLSQIGRHDDAVTEARAAIGVDPTNARAHMSLAHTNLMANRHADAVFAASAAIAIQPDWEWPHRLMAVAYRSQGKKFRKRELAAAEQALRLAPEYAEVHYTMAETLRHNRKTRKRAYDEAERAIELSPEDDTAHLTLGNVHLSDGNVVAAEQAYRNALALDPGSESARSNLALVLRRQRRHEEALPILRTNVVSNPSDRSNMDALLATAEEFVKAGPLSKLMRKCFYLSILRFPVVLALLLWPFAKLEERNRIKQLPPDVRVARAQRKAETPRTTRDERFLFSLLVASIFVVIIIALTR